jgi:hypothetical protein
MQNIVGGFMKCSEFRKIDGSGGSKEIRSVAPDVFGSGSLPEV